MRYETYTCSMADGSTEYGFCFKEDDLEAEDCIAPDLVIGAVRGKSPKETIQKLRKGWKQWGWMAQAVCDAAPNKLPDWDSN